MPYSQIIEVEYKILPLWQYWQGGNNMSKTARVENHPRKVRLIYVDEETRACINCAWYEQYFRQNRGNVYNWIPVDTGHCILRDCQRGPLRQACKDFEKEKED